MSSSEFFSLSVLRESEDTARQLINKLLGLPREDLVFERVPLEAYRLRLEILASTSLLLTGDERLSFHNVSLEVLDWWITSCESAYDDCTEHGTERFDIWMINQGLKLQLVFRLNEKSDRDKETDHV